MAKEMLINVSEGEECRIALLENGKLEEFYIERTSATSHVGNIYKGRVVNVEPSIQAAFVDFGMGRNGFLHISDLLPYYFGRQGEEITETVGRKLARRDRPPIQRCLRRGDDIIVQIIKEGIGTKGPTLTTYLSIPGRILVMMPGMSKMGVSRKIEDEVERKRLRQILDSLDPIEECGFIIRTAGVGRTKAEIQRDLAYLTRLWQQVNKKLKSGSGPTELYTEGDLVTRTVRDVFTSEIDAIIVDNARVAEELGDYIRLSSPRAKEKVEFYEGPLPIFHKYNIEKEIEMMYSRHVPLPSGGSLVIDQTEAVVAIDVNSGKFRDHSDAETTAFKTDQEAAEEIPRQLKLRDLGGVIICDFIDLRFDRHRREIERALHDNFKNDRAKTKVLRMSQFGIIELTRQRMRPSVKRSIYYDCPHCRGSGLVKTPESMSLDVMRKLAVAMNDQRVARIELTIHNDVAHYLNNRKRRQLTHIEESSGKRILIKTDLTMGLDEARFELFDSRDGVVMMPDLLSAAPQTIQEAQLMAKQARYQTGDQRSRAPERPQRKDRPVHFDEHDDRYELEELEAAADQVDHVDQAENAEEPETVGAIPDADQPAEPVGEVGADDQAELEEVADEIGEVGEDEEVRDSEEVGEVEEVAPRRDNRGGRGHRDDRRGDRRDGRGEYRRDGRDQRDRSQPESRGPVEAPRPPRPEPQQGQVPAARPNPKPFYIMPGANKQASVGPVGPAVQGGQGGRSGQGDQGGRGGHDDQGGEGRGRRRGRRGRGRFAEQQPVVPQQPMMPPARSPEELLRRLPTNIWIQMPGEEGGMGEGGAPSMPPAPQRRPAPQVPPPLSPPGRMPPPRVAPIAPAPESAPVSRVAPMAPAPIAPAPIAPTSAPATRVVPAPIAPAPIAPTPQVVRPAPRRQPVQSTPVAAQPPKPTVWVEPDVKPAQIAEWPSEPVVRKRPAKAQPAATETPAAEAAAEGEKGTKGKRGRKTTAKAPAAKPAPKAASKSRSRKKKGEAEPEVTLGPTVEGAPIDEPKVRIAEDVLVTKTGDRHLATDEPVDPATVRKVNAPRDLDHIPEDE